MEDYRLDISRRRWMKSVGALTGAAAMGNWASAYAQSGGRVVLDRDAQGRAFVSNFPGTLPALFRTFSALNPAVEALVAGEERLTFAELDQWSERLARALAARGVRKGDRVGIAMRNCSSWVVGYMAALKAGAVATLHNGWWQAHEMKHALELTEPVLILADNARAERLIAAIAEPRAAAALA